MYRRYKDFPLFADVWESRKGICTNSDVRYICNVWEVKAATVAWVEFSSDSVKLAEVRWAPTVQGGKDRAWLEPVSSVIAWYCHGLELKVQHEHRYKVLTKYLVSQDKYFEQGVAFTKIGVQIPCNNP